MSSTSCKVLPNCSLSPPLSLWWRTYNGSAVPSALLAFLLVIVVRGRCSIVVLGAVEVDNSVSTCNLKYCSCFGCFTCCCLMFLFVVLFLPLVVNERPHPGCYWWIRPFCSHLRQLTQGKDRQHKNIHRMSTESMLLSTPYPPKALKIVVYTLFTHFSPTLALSAVRDRDESLRTRCEFVASFCSR